MKSSRSSFKENAPQSTARKSNIPIVQSSGTGKKGRKRDLSPTAVTLNPKRSPSGANRRVLGELPHEQRKLARVRRVLKTNVKDSDVSKKLPPQPKKINFGNEEFKLCDQSDIHFESDASALESILNDTGITMAAPPPPTTTRSTTKTTVPVAVVCPSGRHTLAGNVSKISTTSIAGQSRTVGRNTFGKMCDDFINRVSVSQQKAKRQCLDGHTDKSETSSGYRFDPSIKRTSFSDKYTTSRDTGARPSSPFFKAPVRKPVSQTPLRDSRYSLPARTPLRQKAELPLGARPSLAAQTPLRVIKEDHDNIDNGTESRQSICPNPFRISKQDSISDTRLSLANHTPGRVLKTKKDLNAEPVSDSLSLAPRLSLAAQTPGRVMKTKTDLELNSDIRLSLAPRLSLANQTPGRVLKPKLKDQKVDQNGDIRLSLALRVEAKDSNLEPQGDTRSCEDSRDSRLSLVAQMPKRVPKQVQNLTVHTPVRTPMKESRINLGTPLRQLQPQFDSPFGTPQRTPKPSLPSDNHTPRRVPKPSFRTPIQEQKTQDSPLSSSGKSREITPAKKQDMDTLQSPFSATREIISSPVMKERSGVLKSEDKENVRGSPGQTDLMTMWKTKKTKQKTPIKKEILTSVVQGGVEKETRTPPRLHRQAFTSLKKKKTISWAATLENYRSPGHRKSSSNKGKSSLREGNIDTVLKSLFFHAEDRNCSDDVIPGTLGLDESRTTVADDTSTQWEVTKVTQQNSHNAMQEVPSLESSTTPSQATSLPLHDSTQHASASTHNATLSSSETETTTTLTTMQLPLSVVCQSPYSEIVADVINKNRSQLLQELPDSTEIDRLTHLEHLDQSQSTQLPVESHRSVTQPDLGQIASQIEAGSPSVNKDENSDRLLQQLELCKQKENWLKLQLEQNWSRARGCQSTDQGRKGQSLSETVRNENNNFKSKDNDNGNRMDYTMVANMEYMYETEKTADKSEPLSQGIHADLTCSTELDVNSNITLGETLQTETKNVNTEAKFSEDKFPYQKLPLTTVETFDPQSVIYTTPTRKHPLDCDEENITPFILREKFDNQAVSHLSEYKDSPFSGNKNLKTGSLFAPTALTGKPQDTENQSVTESQEVELPIWTPLALRAVAKRQAGSEAEDKDQKETEIFKYSSIKDKSVESAERLDLSESVAKNVEDVSFLPTKTKQFETVDPLPRTPPSQRSAFRAVSQSKLTPTFGSLSLRGNMDKSKSVTKSRDSAFQKAVFQLANQRYQEALLDDEVELYTCRFVNEAGFTTIRDGCFNPVAKILGEGDEMHFIPIDFDDAYSSLASGLHIEGSAFTKFPLRST